MKESLEKIFTKQEVDIISEQETELASEDAIYPQTIEIDGVTFQRTSVNHMGAIYSGEIDHSFTSFIQTQDGTRSGLFVDDWSNASRPHVFAGYQSFDRDIQFSVPYIPGLPEEERPLYIHLGSQSAGLRLLNPHDPIDLSFIELFCMERNLERADEEDREERFRLTAKIYADGDSILERILVQHFAYSQAHTKEITDLKPSGYEKDGVTFYRLGHNASHEFYLGTKDGKIFKLSFGEGEWNEETETTSYDENITECTMETVGYMGHF